MKGTVFNKLSIIQLRLYKTFRSSPNFFSNGSTIPQLEHVKGLCAAHAIFIFNP